MKKASKFTRKHQPVVPTIELPVGGNVLPKLIKMGYTGVKCAEPIPKTRQTDFVSAYIFYHKRNRKVAMYSTMRTGDQVYFDTYRRTMAELIAFLAKHNARLVSEASVPLKHLAWLAGAMECEVTLL